MNDNRLGGIALMIGAISGLVTMFLHPLGGQMTPSQFQQFATLNISVHALAIAGVPFLFLGAMALTRQLDSPGRLAVAALVIYGLSLVAVLIAPALSGLVATEVIRHIIVQGPATEQWQRLLSYTFILNQAFSGIFAVGSAAAIALWSFVIVRKRKVSSALGVYGLLLGAVVVIAVLRGALRLGVHGFALLVVSEASWLIAAGILLLRSKPAEQRSPVAA